MQCGFVNFDDPDYVTANPHVQGGLTWGAVKWAFGNMEQAAYWAPLMWLSHMLAWQWFGLNPWGHHLMNVLLHAASVALVFLLFQRMTRAMWRSLILAALFGWHPLRVESVAWIAERKDVLSTLFWMLTLLAYLKYVEAGRIQNSKSKVWYGAALAMYVLGLMSKAMLVTLPFVLLLLDYWPLERLKPGRVWQLVMEKIPFFALATGASIVTFVAQNQGGAVATFESLPLEARVGNALISYCRYLGKIFWPADLAVYYPHPGYWPLAEVMSAGMFLCGITVLLFVKRREYPYLLMGWFWFVGTLVPVIQLVQSGGQAIADRFTYVPSLGVLILIIWGVPELVRGWHQQKPALWVLGSVAIILCLTLTRQQLGYWKNGETLFRHTLEVTSDNELAHNNLGFALDKEGQIDEAMIQFQEAIRLKPDYAEAHYNLGVACLERDQTDEAMIQFQEAIRFYPDYALAHNNLGYALVRKGRTDEAMSQYQEAIRLNLNYSEAHFNLANAFIRKGRTDKAMSQYQEAIRLKPDYADAHNGLGVALFNQGHTAGAINQFQEAIRLKPDDSEAQRNLAKAVELKSQSNVQANEPAKP